MTAVITPSRLEGAVTPPPSKSQVHRLLIAAALARGESLISNTAYSQDILATLDCLEALGACAVREENRIRIRGLGGAARRGGVLPVLNCRESGSTLRFLIPAALVLAGGGRFTGSDRLMERPQEPYARLFQERGVEFSRDGRGLRVCGRLAAGEFRLPGNVSSQFVTGLLFALPLLEGESRILLTSPLESGGYVDLTLQALRAFGAEIHPVPGGWRVPGGQRWQARDAEAEADYSQAAFFFAANALGNAVEVTGLNPDSLQGDRKMLAFVRRLRGPGTAELDVSQCPDLVPALAAQAALRAGRATVLANAARLRLKESDRLSAVTRELNALGGRVEEHPDHLVIYGADCLRGGAADAHNDHRIAMMLAVAASRCGGPVTLTGAESVQKSHPGFWEDYARLGGRVSFV